jgi:hypothetical protein
MYLLISHREPGSGVAEIGALGQDAHAEYIAIEAERALRVRDQDAGMRNAQVVAHAGSLRKTASCKKV